jgi:Trk K+ transport system NAD-binding subunit
MKDKIVIFGDNLLSDDIQNHLEKENEKFSRIYDASNYEDEDELLSLGIKRDVEKVFVLMNSLETNIFLILSIRAIDKNVKIFSKSGGVGEREKLKLAGADEVLDYNDLTSHRIFNLIKQPRGTDVLDKTIFTETGVQILEIEIKRDSKYFGENIAEINLESSLLIGVVVKNGDFIFSRENYIVESGDTLIFVYL